MSGMSNSPPPVHAHELIRCVGTGAFGEVWLAQNMILGTYRAVKIVYRARFDSDKPFERELRGIRHFEPFSRSHLGLVAVLQIGPEDVKGGYFYYVMEIADDMESGPRIDPETYKPRTLASELHRRGRFTLTECAEIAWALGAALDHLHNQRLVHRDIKPSNIIFVNGVPKLADVGLVTSFEERSGGGGGTMFYIPPEGPGTPAADIFSLGKVIYEMATGNHAEAFPVLPTSLDSDAELGMMKLNPIFNKACDQNPQLRYQSAAQLCAALAAVLRNSQPPPDDPPTPTDDPEPPLKDYRVAILYRPNTAPDDKLAKLLDEQLTSLQCAVFTDKRLIVGMDWAKTIEDEIHRANAVIVLLSEASVASEMMAWEVETARQNRESRSHPMILPVRVQYEDPFPDALGAILDRLHCFKWSGEEDNERMLEALLRALLAAKPIPEKKVRPSLASPTGAVPLDCPFYVVRPTDREFHDAIARHDGIVLVKGARQMGKTSLLARGLHQARQAGDNVVWTDLQKLNTAQLNGVEPFLQALGEFLAVQLNLDKLPIDVWDQRRGANTNFDTYLRREVFGKISGHLVWMLDEVDRLFACNFGGEVFGLFRSWYNERAGDPAGPWSRLTLAVAYATEAHLFITDANMSPFNVGTRVALEDFTFDQVADLNRRYGSPLNDAAVQRLFTLSGGQPYLVRRALHELTEGNVTFPRLLATADRDEGILGDHLRRILVMLAKDPVLAEAVRGILQGRPCPSEDSFYRLRSAGIVKGDSPPKAQMRCELYANYLKTHLM